MEAWDQIAVMSHQLTQKGSERAYVVVIEQQGLHVSNCKGGSRVKHSLQACSPWSLPWS